MELLVDSRGVVPADGRAEPQRQARRDHAGPVDPAPLQLFIDCRIDGEQLRGGKGAAKQLTAALRDGMFRQAYVSGTLSGHLRGQHVSAMARALLKVRVRGRRMASDIRAGRRFPLQNLAGRLPYALLLRPMIRQGIANNKEAMKGVYEALVRTGIVVRSEARSAGRQMDETAAPTFALDQFHQTPDVSAARSGQ